MNLLTNDEVIAVDQDPLVKPAKKMLVNNGQIWYKPLDDGSVAVGLFNIDPYEILWDQAKGDEIQERKYKIVLDLNQIGLRGKYKVRDLWRQKDIGIVNKKYIANVPYHGVSFVRLIPIKNN
jgi:alpha-galactosidase